MMGIGFYLAADLIVGLVLTARFGFKSAPFFQSLLQIVMTSLMSNVMTFMVVWVLFHNLVYIL